MKKWIIGIVVSLVAISAFVICSQSISSAENYCYYNQTLVYDNNEHILEGKETVGFYNYTDSILSNVSLHLYPNAFRQGAKSSVVSLANYEKAYPKGKDYGYITIESVSTKEEYLTYEIVGVDENILSIEMPNKLYPNELFEFEIGFSVKLANINHRLGYGNNTINICNYYPILCVYENGEYITDLYNSNGDPFYSKIANYEVSVTYSKDLTLASTGVQKNVLDGDNITTTIKAQKVRDFAMVLSSKFQTVTDKYDDIEINYYHYDDTTAKQTITAIKQVLEFNKKYGEYPYSTLSVVEANFVHGGMEYPNLVLISDDLYDYDTYINVVVHELCHQWWYGIVGNNQYTYGFLDEGLTDYNTAKFYDAYPEYKHSSEEIFKNATASYTTFTKVYGDIREDFSTNMIRRLDEFETENEYVYVSYVKGMLLFSSLEDYLGQKKLDKAIKYYYECNKYKEATPQDLINAISSSAGKNMQSYFDSWFNGEVVIGEF